MSFKARKPTKLLTLKDKPSNRIKGSLSLTSEESTHFLLTPPVNKLIDVKKQKTEMHSKSFISPQLRLNHKRTKSYFDKKSSFNQTDTAKFQPVPPLATSPTVLNDDSSQEFTFAETFNIISEIQYQFENSLKENKKPISEIKRLIDNDLNIYNYVFLSQEQKDNITKDIERSSDLRIQNYENVFKYIKSSLEGINNCLENIVNQEEDSNDYDNNEYEDDNEMIETSEGVVSPPEKGRKARETEPNDGSLGDDCDLDEEESDFSAGVMLENALVLPPKSSPFNYQNGKDITRMRSKKFSVKKNPMATSSVSQPIKHNSKKKLEGIDKEDSKEKAIQAEELAMLASSVEKIDKEKECSIV